MSTLLVAIIYLSFISLGLPDSIIGAGWPAMCPDIDASLSSVGTVQMVISAFTIISAVLSDSLIRKFGTGLLTGISILLTAAAMLLFSSANSFAILLLWAVPYGLGAGAIDSALNTFVAINLSSKHLNWLHCCWSVGAILSPYLMSLCIEKLGSWRYGFFTVSVIQAILTAVVFIFLPLWKKAESSAVTVNVQTADDSGTRLSFIGILKYPGTLYAFFGFLCYCFLESIPIYFVSSYMRDVFGAAPDKAALYAICFAAGMAVCRGLCGIVAVHLNDRLQIRLGLSCIILSSVILILPAGDYRLSLAAFILMGFGCGPVYPGFVHSVPEDFGIEHSGQIMGVMLAFAYVGFTVSPIAFQAIADLFSMRAFGYVVIVMAVICLILTELLNNLIHKQKVGC